jgi:hypothetical protein
VELEFWCLILGQEDAQKRAMTWEKRAKEKRNEKTGMSYKHFLKQST